MTSNILNRFNITNSRALLGIILLITFFSSAYAQNDLKPFLATDSNEVIETTKQNNTELVMFILKCIEDKNIKEANKKIDFVNTFQVSDDIKDQVKTQIMQNMNYSDYRRDSYGLYLNKKCNTHSNRSVSVAKQECFIDNAPSGNPDKCRYERSNICCIYSKKFS